MLIFHTYAPLIKEDEDDELLPPSKTLASEAMKAFNNVIQY